MCESEFFKIVPMELQEKAMSRANLVDNLSRRSSIMPGQSLFPMELILTGDDKNRAICEEEVSDVENESTPKPIPFPYKEVTNENLMNIRNRLGIIDLSFSGVKRAQFVDKYPVTYYSWTEKEQLLLVFAENFRRKFNEKYKLRHSLLLAPENECGIQVSGQIVSEGKKVQYFVSEIRQHDHSSNCLFFSRINRILGANRILRRRFHRVRAIGESNRTGESQTQ